MQKYLFKNIQVVNEGKIQSLDVLTNGERIEKIAGGIETKFKVAEINGEGKHLFPGVIDGNPGRGRDSSHSVAGYFD